MAALNPEANASSTGTTEVRQWRVRNREYKELSDGQQLSRRLDPASGSFGEWSVVSTDGAAPTPIGPEPLMLRLVLHDQAPGEPKHWSLFVSRGEDRRAKGRKWEVTGDATFMRYQNNPDIAELDADSYRTSYVLNSNLTAAQEVEIEQAVMEEKPPQAENRRAVKEACQGWAIRVMRRLASTGIVEQEAVDHAERDLLEPVDNTGLPR